MATRVGFGIVPPMSNMENEDEAARPNEREDEDVATEETSPLLTPEEARVLGSLLEKELTTPEYYPLTMNALLAACNQKSNRTPVVEYTEDEVDEAIAGLRSKGFALRVTVAGSRVAKFQHSLDRALPDLGDPETAILTTLLLRGQQSLAELKTRSERMCHFASLDQAQEALDELEVYPPRQLVKSIEAGGGRRVQTFVHLLCGDPGEGAEVPSEGATRAVSPAAPDWHEKTEAEMATLRSELESLRREFDEFRNQFG